MSEEEEKRLLKEGDAYEFIQSECNAVSPLESKSFQKKLVRIAKQKEKKQLKREAKAISSGEKPSASTIAVSKEQILERYKNSKKQKQVVVTTLLSIRMMRETNRSNFFWTLRSHLPFPYLFDISFKQEFVQERLEYQDIRGNSLTTSCLIRHALHWD